MAHPTVCPFCGASLPSVADPFCPECRRDVDDFDEKKSHQENKSDADASGDGVSKTTLAILAICILVVFKLIVAFMGG